MKIENHKDLNFVYEGGKMMEKNPTIAELENLLNTSTEKVSILPNGKIKVNTPKETIEESLIAHMEKIGELTEENKIFRNVLVHCLGHLQTRVEDNADMMTLRKIEQVLAMRKG